MTREQKIDCMAKALYRLAWGPRSHWPPHNKATHARFIEKAMAVDAGLTAAGMVVVPREPTEAMKHEGAVQVYRNTNLIGRGQELSATIYRTMTEAHNKKPVTSAGAG